MRKEYQSGGRLRWVDLHNPTRDEIAQACAQYHLDIPAREQLEEIEFSSRLQYEDGVFTISVPVTPHTKDASPDQTTPLGFVLTPDLLVTIRFTDLPVWDSIATRVMRRERSAADIFMVFIEAMIDASADRLEELRAQALILSRRIFHKDTQGWRKHKIAKVSRQLRDTLVEIGDMGERVSHTRDTLLVLQRAAPFISDLGKDWLGPDVTTRLKTAMADVQSLNDYEVHLTDKLQFLLDAALGFINTQQNDLFKVMTIWSVAGIPPVLLAGIWGMNFKLMPELNWHYGYPIAIASMVIATIVPLAWFKHRGWW